MYLHEFGLASIIQSSMHSGTSSSAVSERPRDADASHMSVVSFISTIRRTQFSITGYFRFIFTLRTIKLCSVLFGVVVHAGCDKQDLLMRGGLCGKRASI